MLSWEGDAEMGIVYESDYRSSLYDPALGNRWFTVNRYYSITYPALDMVDLHAHTELEIMYVVSGQGTVNLENGSLLLQEGEYVIIDSLVPHNLCVAPGHPCRVLNIEALLAETDGIIRLDTLMQEDVFRRMRGSRLSSFHGKDDDNALKDAILGLHRLHQRLAPRMEIDFQMSLILLEISRQLFSDPNKKAKGTPPYVKRAVRFISENYDRELTIDEIAVAAGISKAHLQRSFLKYEGSTIVESINRLRLDKARFLLVTSAIPIVDIANEVGFSSRQYFTGLFTRSTGLTPADFRRHQQGNMAAGFNNINMGAQLASRRRS